MSTLAILGFEMNSTASGGEAIGTTGIGTITTRSARSGVYGYEISGAHNNASTTGTLGVVHSGGGIATSYHQWCFNAISLPNNSAYTFRCEMYNSATEVASIRFSYNGTELVCNVYINAGTLVGTANMTGGWTLNKWHVVEARYDTSPVDGSEILEVRINGVQILALANLTFTTKACTHVRFAARNDTGSVQNPQVYCDDIVSNDTVTAFQNTWPASPGGVFNGGQKVVMTLPNGPGDANMFGTQVGGVAGAVNNWTRVTQYGPFDDATSYNGSTTLNDDDYFTVAPSTAIGANDQICSVHVANRLRNDVADATENWRTQIKKASGGTIGTSTGNAVVNNTTWRTNMSTNANPSYHKMSVDPDGIWWTRATLDTMQIGYRLAVAPGTAGRRIDFTFLCAMIAYVPARVQPRTTLLAEWGVESAATSGTTITTSPPITLPVGTLVVIGYCCIAAAGVYTVTDTKGNIWTVSQDQISGGGNTTTLLISTVLTTALTTSDVITIVGTDASRKCLAAAAFNSPVEGPPIHSGFNETTTTFLIADPVTPPVPSLVFGVTGFLNAPRVVQPQYGFTAGTKRLSTVGSGDRAVQLVWRDSEASVTQDDIGQLHSSGTNITALARIPYKAAEGWKPGTPKRWDGGAWVPKPMKVWDGSAWVVKPVKVWTGGKDCADVLLEPFNSLAAWTGTLTLVAGRTGTAMNIQGSSNADYTVPVAGQSPFFTFGFAYKASVVNTSRRIFTFRNVDNSDLASLWTTTASGLQLVGGNSSPTWGTSVGGLLTAGVWAYIEVQLYVSNTEGFFTVKCNGTTLMSGAGLDTMVIGTGSTSLGHLFLLGAGSLQTCQWDDLYLSVGAQCPFKGSISIP